MSAMKRRRPRVWRLMFSIMKRRPANSWSRIASCAIAGALFLSVVLACGMRKPWKDYTKKPFDSEKWRNGDRVDRGTMYFDLFEKRTLNSKRKDEVAQLLGEPDKKAQVEGREVWLYRIDVVGEWDRPCFPVSFEPNGKTFAGMVKGGTMSMIVEEAEAR
jgi:hypothetical protein